MKTDSSNVSILIFQNLQMNSYEKFLHIEQQEKENEVGFALVSKTENSIKTSNNLYSIILYVLAYSIALFVMIRLNNNFKFSFLFYCLFIAVYPYLIIGGILLNLLESKVSKQVYKRYKTSENEIKNFKELKRQLIRSKYEVTKEMHREEEEEFVQKLTEFINKITYRKIPFEEAYELKKQLEVENLNIKANGYQIHREIFYKNRFDKIETIIKNYSPVLPAEETKEITKEKKYTSNTSVYLPKDINTKTVEKYVIKNEGNIVEENDVINNIKTSIDNKSDKSITNENEEGLISKLV
jgi:hypothetical protein